MSLKPYTLILHLFNPSPWQGDRGEARGYVARLLQMGVGVGTATAAGFLLGRTALPSLFTADSQVASAWDRPFELQILCHDGSRVVTPESCMLKFLRAGETKAHSPKVAVILVAWCTCLCAIVMHDCCSGKAM